MTEIKFVNYGQARDVDPTPEELEIFGIIQGLNNKVRLVRRSDKYVSASLGRTDVARFKYTNRAKWIEFPYTVGKIKLNSLADVGDLADEIENAINKAIEINSY